MEAAAASAVRTPIGVSRAFPSSVARYRFFPPTGPHFVRFPTKHYSSSASSSKPGRRRVASGRRRCTIVKASSSSSSDASGSLAPIAPLRLESPIGQLLFRILISHPHLVPAAVEQQLEQLQSDREAEMQKQVEPSATGTDLVLYRRIAELRANDRRKALEEIYYALVVQKFMDANISLVPSMTPVSSESSGQVDNWPSQDKKLEQLHSPEVYEMIQNHLALVLGNRLGDSTSVSQISKLRVGQVYAASVMYGYFLKRVDQRLQLEKTMKMLPNAIDKHFKKDAGLGMKLSGREDSSQAMSSHPELSAGDISAGGFGYGFNSLRLRTYVMSFDVETLQRYATIRSREAINIIEKHTEALFGRSETVLSPQGTIDPSNVELIRISLGGLKRLILEAVTFGSFLWDVESYVDSRYHFVLN